MTTAAPANIHLRVTIADTWLPLEMRASESDTVAALKTRALAASHIDASKASTYEVKRGGVLIDDETATLGALSIKSGAPLIILSKRRRPVR